MADIVFYAAVLLLPIVLSVLIYAFFKCVKRGRVKPRWLGLVAGNLLIFLLFCSVVFLALESYYRFWYDEPDALGTTKVSGRWRERHYQFNRASFRDNIDYVFGRAEGKRRITFIGDSYTVGHGVPNVDDRFANVPRKMKPNWEVHTLAAIGIGTGQEVELLGKSIGYGYEFDQVVLVYSLNDIDDMVLEWQEGLKQIHRDAENASFFVKHSFFINIWYYRLKSRTWLYNEDYYCDLIAKAYGDRTWEVQKRRLDVFTEMVRAAGGRLLVVTFPFLHTMDDGYEYATIHEKLDRFWLEMGVPHLDMLSIYEKLPSSKITVNRYDAHPSVYAHSLAADAVGKFIEEHLEEVP